MFVLGQLEDMSAQDEAWGRELSHAELGLGLLLRASSPYGWGNTA